MPVLPDVRMPLYLLCRDRLECLRQMVDWFTDAAGVREIILVDFHSTYPPLLDYYKQSGLRVMPTLPSHDAQTFMAGTLMQRVAFGNGAPFGSEIPLSVQARMMPEADGFYAVSDCDCVPTDDTPKDLLLHLAQAHLDFRIHKAGPGLRIDDLPAHYPYRDAVRRAEQAHWETPFAPGWFVAPIDTTLAVYRGHWWEQRSGLILRSDFPYVVRHHSWYSDVANLPPDEDYYVRHAIAHAGSYRGHVGSYRGHVG